MVKVGQKEIPASFSLALFVMQVFRKILINKGLGVLTFWNKMCFLGFYTIFVIVGSGARGIFMWLDGANAVHYSDVMPKAHN